MTGFPEVFERVRKDRGLTNHHLDRWALGPEYLVRSVTKTTGHHRFYRVSAAGKVSIVASTTSGLLLHKAVPQSYRNRLRLLLEQFATDFESIAALYDEETQLSLAPLAMPRGTQRKTKKD